MKRQNNNLVIIGVLILVFTYSFTTIVGKGGSLLHAATTGYYQLSSGTGFFITKQYVVTNAHVVENCKSIVVRGAIKPSEAEIVDTDKKNDLALLKTTKNANYSAMLRSNDGLKKGDEVTVIGYPMENGISGKYVLEKARILNVNYQFEGIKSIEFTDSVRQGNSGGPLLDIAGNVIGVVVGNVSYYLQESAKDEVTENDKPFKTSSVAIGLPVLETFLKHNHVYAFQNMTYDFMEKEKPELSAEKYLVNVHCIQN